MIKDLALKGYMEEAFNKADILKSVKEVMETVGLTINKEDMMLYYNDKKICKVDDPKIIEIVYGEGDLEEFTQNLFVRMFRKE